MGKTGLEVQLNPGAVGELSVYWNEERISIKGDSLEAIIAQIQKKQDL